MFIFSEVNSDVMGWIEIPSTNINYPVVQAEDNDYYLKHNIKKEESIHGSIFMDYRNKKLGQERHTILYGHHMKDGSMFHDLDLYNNQNFYKENPYIYTVDKSGRRNKWEVFSAYVSETDFYYLDVDFSSVNKFEQFINQLNERSLINTEVDLMDASNILTLSTCDYSFDNARYVVHAMLVKDS
jgi:sortase B